MADPRARMLATVLFTDIVRSTELATELGDTGWQDLLTRHHAIVRAELARFGGREVDTAGDGFFSVFDVPTSAVRCAQAVIDSLAPLDIEIRAGVHTGEVSLIADKIGGIAAHIGARVMAAGSAGEVLVSSTVKDLVAGSDLVFNDRGAHTLKGFAEPWHLFALESAESSSEPAHASVLPPEWGTEDPGGIPLPPPLRSDHLPSSDDFIGRADELNVLTSSWKAAAAGERQAIFVGGEPGIGKTRLATEMAVAAHAEGATVLFGRCEEDLAVPYQPFVEALRHYVAFCPAAGLVEHVNRHNGELVRLVPDLARRVPGVPQPRTGEPATERYWLFEACVGLLATASHTSPVLLLLDDLQWAAAPTLLLLKHLLGSKEGMALLVIGTYRTTDLSKTHPFTDVLADLHRENGVERLLVRGLGDTDTIALVEGVAGHDLDDKGVALAHALGRETEGNPFFMRQILRHLSQSGAIYQRDGRWTYSGDVDRLAIPASVREVVSRRVLRLSDDASRALSQASVIGRDFDLTVLSRVTEYSEDRLLDAMDEAAGAALVAEAPGQPGMFTFSHVLIRHTLYEELSMTRRMRMHRRVAEALESLHGAESTTHLAELARHWFAATPAASVDPGDLAKAIDFARRAAERATQLLAYEEAAGHYERALQTLRLVEDSKLEECRLSLALGDVRWRAGNVTQAKETFLRAGDTARLLSQPELFSRAALGYGTGLGGAGFGDRADQQLITFLEEALTGLGHRDSVPRVLTLSRLAVELYFTELAERRAELSGQAVEMAQRLGDPEAELVALYSQQWSLLGPDHAEERLSAGGEILRIADAVGNREMSYRGHHIRLRSYVELGRMVDVDVEIDACQQLADELRQPLYVWQTMMFRAMRALASIPFDEGERLAFGALEIGKPVAKDVAEAAFGGQLGLHRFFVGRTEEVLPVIKSAAERLPWEPAWRAAVAWLCSELDREEEARAQFEILATNGFVDLPRNGNWSALMQFASRTCSYLGDAARAELLYEQLSPYRERIGVGGTGSARFDSNATAMGVLATTLGRWDEAEAHFERATEHNAATPWIVLTARDYASMLLRRDSSGDRERALRHINEAGAVAQQCGMTALLEQLATLKSRAQAQPGDAVNRQG